MQRDILGQSSVRIWEYEYGERNTSHGSFNPNPNPNPSTRNPFPEENPTPNLKI